MLRARAAVWWNLVNPPPRGAFLLKKRVNEPFENVSMRTPPILGALNPKNMLSQSKQLLFGYSLSKVTFWLVKSLVVVAVEGAGPCGGGGEGVLAVCGTTALVGTVVRMGVLVVVVPVVDVMVCCGVVRRVGWLACRGRLRWGVVVMQLVGAAVVLGHQGVGVGGGGGVVMVLVAPHSLALREWWSLSGVDLCGWWSSAGLPG